MKKNVIRLLFALVALLTSTSMLAENKIWIDSFSVTNAGTVVPIQMTNDNNAAALQFNLILPDELEIVPTMVEGTEQYIYRNSERLSNTQRFMCKQESDNNYKVAIFSMQKESFIGNEGPVAFFQVKVKDNVIAPTTQSNVKLENILMSTAAGDKLECDASDEADVTLNAVIKVYSEPSELVVNPGSTLKFPVYFMNSDPVQGLQMNITLPEGFVLNNEFEHSDRLSDGASISLSNNNDGTYRLVLVDIYGGNAIRNEAAGVIFYCTIYVPEEFASDSKIVISDVIASEGSQPYSGDGFSVNLVNGNDARDKAQETIDGLRTKLAEAQATIAETCPDVAADFPGTEIKESIDALEAAVTEAYENLTLTPDYETIMAPVAGIEEAIDALVADATEAQATETQRRADNLEAYNKTKENLDALQTLLDNTVEEIKAEYLDYIDNDAIEAVQAMINDARKEAADKYEEVEFVPGAVYVDPVDQATINTAIDNLIAAAAAAKAEAEEEADRVAKNEAAHQAALADIADVQAHYDEVVAQIKSEYADFEDEEAEKNVQKDIDDTEYLANKALEDVADAGEYEFVVEKDNLMAAIDALLAEAQAKAKQNAEDLENARKEENKAAYEADLALIDELLSLYRETVTEIQTNYAAFENVSAELAVRNDIDAAKADIEKAYKAVEKENKYSYELDFDGLSAKIQKLLDDAKAAKEAADAETLRQNENLSEYNRVVGEIDDLQAKLDAAVAQIQKDYAEYEDKDAEAAVQAQIDAIRDAALKAFEAVANEGKFEYTVVAAPVEAAIAQLLADAKAAKEAADAEAKRKADNLEAYNAVIDQLKPLEDRFNEVVAEIKKDYAAFENEAAEKAVKENLQAVREGADYALEAVAEEGNFEFSFDADTLRAEIEQLLEDAKALAAADDERAAQNKSKYDAVKDEIAALRAELDAAVEKIIAEYPDYNATAEVRAITKELDDIESACDAAYEAVATEGNFEFTFDADKIHAEIEAMLASAGVDVVGVEDGDVVIFTLDGKRHERPVHGEVNILVRKNGERSKVYIK